MSHSVESAVWKETYHIFQGIQSFYVSDFSGSTCQWGGQGISNGCQLLQTQPTVFQCSVLTHHDRRG